MLLQGDALAVQLFIGSGAVAALSVAMTQAGWTQKWFVRAMFGLAVLLAIAFIGWPYFEDREPLIAAWSFMGIVSVFALAMAVVIVVVLGDKAKRKTMSVPIVIMALGALIFC